MSLRIKYLDVPEGAQEVAQVEGRGQPFSDMSLVASGAKDIAYATLESDGWPLDGSRKTISASTKTGFWSTDPSNGDTAVMDDYPIITLSFPEKYTATGITITFSPSTNEWCKKIIVTWYSGSARLCKVTSYPNDAYWIIKQTVEGFDKVTVELLETNLPGHFAKVQRIEVGQTLWFDQDEITSVHIVNEIDPSLSELSVDTMQIDINDRQDRSLIPQKNQKMELYQDDNLYAVHYIASSSREARRCYTFSCQSVIGLLDEDYMGGIYNDTPIMNVLADVLEGFAFKLNKAFSDMTISGYLPICTRREALQQVVFAIGAMITTQGTSTIRLEPIPTTVSKAFTKSDIFQGAKVETEPRIAKVEVTAHKYTKSSEVETLMDSEDIRGENVLVTFTEPHHGYSITGGTITGSSANWVRITANGKVTLTGKKYLHSTVRHSKRNTEATASERNNVFAAENATLVHSGNVTAVLQRLYDISILRQTLTQEVVVTTQRAGQIVPTENPWGEVLQGYITLMESDLTPTGHTAAVTVLGVESDNN